MLRDKNLVPLSHQHQHALALCVRIERGLDSGLRNYSTQENAIRGAFELEIEKHFDAEECILFPAVAKYHETRDILRDLLSEHVTLRGYKIAASAHAMNRSDLFDFSSTLTSHIQKEERLLFELCQRLMPEHELAAVGRQLQEFFRGSAIRCT